MPRLAPWRRAASHRAGARAAILLLTGLGSGWRVEQAADVVVLTGTHAYPQQLWSLRRKPRIPALRIGAGETLESDGPGGVAQRQSALQREVAGSNPATPGLVVFLP